MTPDEGRAELTDLAKRLLAGEFIPGVTDREELPLEPISTAELEAAVRRFDHDAADFDAVCILGGLYGIAGRILAEEAGEEWYGDSPHPDQQHWVESGGRIIDALLMLGAIRREDFIYDELTRGWSRT